MKTKRALYLLGKLKNHVKNCAIHRLDFSPMPHGTNQEDRETLEAHQKERFELWWNSRIAPEIEELERILTK